MVRLVGGEVAERARDDRPRAVQLRRRAGGDPGGSSSRTPSSNWASRPTAITGRELVLIDEVMTPDSSRFWDASSYEPGHAQPSFDKQYVRDWLEAQPWDKTPPGPELPPEVVDGTRARYVEAFERITGALFARYLDGGCDRLMATYRFAVSVMPKEGILDPQGRAVETSLPHLGVRTVHGVRVGRRVELSVDAPDEGGARAVVERLAGELFANPLIETWWIDGDAGEAVASDGAPASGEGPPPWAVPCAGSLPREGRGRRLPGLELRPGRAARRPAGGCGGRAPVARVDRSPRLRPRDPARRLRLRRLPARRRHRALQPDHGRGPRPRGARRAGARHLQRVPGARGGRARAGRPAAERVAALRAPLDAAFRRAVRHAVHAGGPCRSDAAHADRARRGLLLPAAADLEALEAAAASSSATRARRAIRTVRCTTSPAWSTIAATSAA